MDDDSDTSNDNNYEEELYSVSRRVQKLRHIRSNMTRMQRRTALSLRPVSQKSYVDTLSPDHYNSDSEGQLRRSKRRVRVRFQNTSWLADNQIHKVGYPNLTPIPYSEEDSRDNIVENTRENKRTTRLSNHLKNGKEPDAEDQGPMGLRSRNSSEKIEKEETGGRTRFRARNMQTDVKSEVKDQDDNEEKTADEDKDESNDKKANDVEEKDDKKEESESDEESEEEAKPRRSLPPRGKRKLMNEKFNTGQRRRVRKDSSSSESFGVKVPNSNKRYSFRVRQPKPTSSSISRPMLRGRESKRRHYARRRRNSSSSSSASDSDRCVREKYSKTPKSSHSKTDQKMKSGTGGSQIIPIGPETLDSNIRFSSIGGLDCHIQSLKEMILLPMMYPEVFEQFKIKPPRGVLFHGPPGTGKTLMARALANECNFGKRKVSFFMRKGADLLSKWIGESEKQLRLLFEQAQEMKPSIIFFDEIDGLAPVRSSRQDQIHASIVTTLLPLMDGLDDRGEVIIIGATNRIDTIDPALRRPGRFDRELYFPLPALKEREEILNVHVSEWENPPNPQLISYLAEQAVGYCGSDLRALCSEAVIKSFRRTYPQVYDSEHKLLLEPKNVNVNKLDFIRAKSELIPASHRIVEGVGKKLLPILEPLLGETMKSIFAILDNNFPHGVHPKLAKVKLSPNVRPAQILLWGYGEEHGQSSHIAPALIHKMEHIHCCNLDFKTLYKEPGGSAEEATLKVFVEAKRNVPSLIYIPKIDIWWSLVSETTRAILCDQISDIDAHVPILILATSHSSYEELPQQIKLIFSQYRKEVFEIKPPSLESRQAFFSPLLIDASLKPVRLPRTRPKTPPQLPRAPTPPPPPLTMEQKQKLFEQEEHILRELRIFLRDMCRKLANNKLFYIFTKPVDTDEVPDYTNIIKEPMDLETMMTKVDFHRYTCAKDFLMDIELICKNALEYNPAKTSVDKQIRHRACTLRDYAYTLIKNEMDTDFEDKCQTISNVRKVRADDITKCLPEYIITADSKLFDEQDSHNSTNETGTVKKIESTPKWGLSRKRKVSSWQRGMVKKPKRTSKPEKNEDSKNADKSSDDCKENNIEVTSESNSLTEMNDIKTTPKPESPIKNNTVESSPKILRRRISDLMSPSELLEDPLEFDDVDQALNECESNASKLSIKCPKEKLDALLEEIVSETQDYSVSSLLDLHNQLSKIVRSYMCKENRINLPTDLKKEFVRFQNEEKGE